MEYYQMNTSFGQKSFDRVYVRMFIFFTSLTIAQVYAHAWN